MPISWDSGSQLRDTSRSTSDVQPCAHRHGVRGEVAMADLHRLRYPGRPRGELPHRDIRLVGVVGLDRLGAAQRLDGADGQIVGRQMILGDQEGLPDDDQVGTNHQDRPHGVGEPDRQVRARCRLLQHRQRGAAQPDRLGERCDIPRVGSQHRDRAVAANSPGGQASGHPLRLFVDFAPCQPHGISECADGQTVRRRCRRGKYFAGQDAHRITRSRRPDRAAAPRSRRDRRRCECSAAPRRR